MPSTPFHTFLSRTTFLTAILVSAICHGIEPDEAHHNHYKDTNSTTQPADEFKVVISKKVTPSNGPPYYENVHDLLLDYSTYAPLPGGGMYRHVWYKLGEGYVSGTTYRRVKVKWDSANGTWEPFEGNTSEWVQP